MTNYEIRAAAKEYGVPLWRLAEGLGIADTTLSKKLRKEFSADEKSRALEVIERISKGVSND